VRAGRGPGVCGGGAHPLGKEPGGVGEDLSIKYSLRQNVIRIFTDFAIFP